jgi:hypothetical protein
LAQQMATGESFLRHGVTAHTVERASGQQSRTGLWGSGNAREPGHFGVTLSGGCLPSLTNSMAAESA